MISEHVHRTLTGRTGDAADGQSGSFVIHLLALGATRIADGLIDPKLVLAWLLSALGAPGALIGALVPVREAGALLPQLALAGAIQRLSRRKVVWAAGSALQGAAALGIALAAVTLSGPSLGWAILGCLAILAVARSACSASYKDVLARTVGKGSRGTVSGAAGTIAAIAVLGFAAALGTGLMPRTPQVIAGAVAAAGALWLAAGFLFLRLDEPAADPAPHAGHVVRDLFAPLVRDAQLRRYLAARILLISTALAPPFLVILSAGGDRQHFGNLGMMLIGSACAAILSSFVWGRLSDRSSRRTLVLAGLLASVVFGVAAITGLVVGGLGGALATTGFIFAGQVAYEGARAGRKTHLTDMDAGGRRTLYTALSNTIVGAMLLAGGVFGLLADALGAAWVMAIFAGMAAAGGAVALGLDEVQS